MKITKSGVIDERQQYALDSFQVGDSWRLFRIMSEFVDGFDTLASIGRPAVSIFGSARTPIGDKYFELADKIAYDLALWRVFRQHPGAFVVSKTDTK